MHPGEQEIGAEVAVLFTDVDLPRIATRLLMQDANHPLLFPHLLIALDRSGRHACLT